MIQWNFIWKIKNDDEYTLYNSIRNVSVVFQMWTKKKSKNKFIQRRNMKYYKRPKRERVYVLCDCSLLNIRGKKM